MTDGLNLDTMIMMIIIMARINKDVFGKNPFINKSIYNQLTRFFWR